MIASTLKGCGLSAAEYEDGGVQSRAEGEQTLSSTDALIRGETFNPRLGHLEGDAAEISENERDWDSTADWFERSRTCLETQTVGEKSII